MRLSAGWIRGAGGRARAIARAGGLRLLVVAQIVLNVIAVVAAVVAIQDATSSRRAAARDSCELLLGLVHSAAPPSRSAAVRAYVDRTPLHNCNAYARTVVR